jgi:hypothetical protein
VKEIITRNKNANKSRLSLIKRRIKIENPPVLSPIKPTKLSTKEFLLRIVGQMVQSRRGKSLPL